jgi:hypothetical protein
MTDDTTAQLFHVPARLTERQAFVYLLAQNGPLDATQAGVALHLKHKRQCGCGPERACEWAASNGRAVLEALRRKGLLKRDRHHVYQRADSTEQLQAGEHDPATSEIPY